MTRLYPTFFAFHALVQLSFVPFPQHTASVVTNYLIPEGKQKPIGSSITALSLQWH